MHLCVLICGRSRTPNFFARRDMCAALRRTRSRSRSREGVFRASRAEEFVTFIIVSVVDSNPDILSELCRDCSEELRQRAGIRVSTESIREAEAVFSSCVGRASQLHLGKLPV